MEEEYRVLSGIEKHDAGWCEDYDVLIGPNNFECGLTEPEDRNWYRDGRTVVDELNRLHWELKAEKERADELSRIVKSYKKLIEKVAEYEEDKRIL